MSAISDEAETLFKSYMEGIGAALEALPDGQPLFWYYPVTQEYFTVYTSNAALIGRLSNPELRRRIVRTYALARSLIDASRLNNSYFEKYEQAAWMAAQAPDHGWNQRAAGERQAMVNYAPTLKKIHGQVKAETAELLEQIREELQISR